MDINQVLIEINSLQDFTNAIIQLTVVGESVYTVDYNAEKMKYLRYNKKTHDWSACFYPKKRKVTPLKDVVQSIQGKKKLINNLGLN